MKRITIIATTILVSLLLIAIGIYGSLQFYYEYPASDDEVSVSFHDFQFVFNNITIHDFDNYELKVSMDALTDELSKLRNVKLDSSFTPLDTTINKIDFDGNTALAYMTISTGLLKFPIKVKFDIIAKKQDILLHITEIKCGWIPIKPSRIDGVNKQNKISFDLNSFMPEGIPILLENITLADDNLVLNLSLNKSIMKQLIDDYSVGTYRDLQDTPLPQITSQNLSLKLSMFNDSFDRYLKDTLTRQDLPLGFSITDSHIDLDELTISLDVRWLFIEFTMDAKLDLQVEANILKYRIETLSLGGFDINNETLAFFENMLGGYSIDLNKEGMDWLVIHKASIDSGYLSVTISVDLDRLLRQGIDIEAIKSSVFYDKLN